MNKILNLYHLNLLISLVMSHSAVSTAAIIGSCSKKCSANIGGICYIDKISLYFTLLRIGFKSETEYLTTEGPILLNSGRQ